MPPSIVFDRSQRTLIRQLSKQLRNVGYLWAVASILGFVLDIVSLINYLSRVDPTNALDIFKKPIEDLVFFDLVRSAIKQPLFIIVSLLAIRSASFFQAIADEEGPDMENLFAGLSQLRNTLFLLFVYAILFIGILWVRLLFF